ncbi:hypothetical protein DID80_02810 [Candidatus Marinamargulisbacteria bacterium SCGC AAA071-K20]|nr:hypothetical protein DID80_02810 [Candidatus Marinamargulisbacteria bacterium SCGC AAA071-K20]
MSIIKTILKIVGASLLGLIISLSILFYYAKGEETKGYAFNLAVESQKGPILAGFSKQSIVPKQLKNMWMAGFGNNREATGVHDPLWARAIVIQRGDIKIALVVLDAIGLFYDDVVDIRTTLQTDLDIDYVMVSSTHCHESPDLIGIWGPESGRTGVDDNYLAYVKSQSVAAIKQAHSRLEKVKIEHYQDDESAKPLLEDTRNPLITDHSLKGLVFYSKNTDSVVGSLISWANHPEVLWSENTLISSDFVHYVREGVENGVEVKGKRIPGLGGISVYINGAVGGLMTTSPSWEVKSLKTGEMLTGATFERAEAVGDTLAYIYLKKVMNSHGSIIENERLAIAVKTIYLPLKNINFRLGMIARVIKRGLSGWSRKVKSEVAYIELGPLSIVTVPGEIYPEIVNGGVEAPTGQDYDITPVEVPALRKLMGGKHKYVFGITNDFIGYIVPKSQWDVKEPYTYKQTGAPYGEVNSLGPDTAPIVYQALKSLIIK